MVVLWIAKSTMSNKVCPCGKKKPGYQFIQCSEDDCDIGWWHAACSGFSKDVTKRQLDALGHWSCPCCIVKKLQAPGYNVDSCNSCHGLVSKVKSQVENLETQISELKKLKQDFADCNKQQVEVNRSWSQVAASSPSGEGSFVASLAKQVVDHSTRMSVDKENRERNVIIFNVVESSSEIGSERKEHDKKLFDDICNITLKQSIPVKNISRLGNVQVNDSDETTSNAGTEKTRPRPLKISFANTFDKRKFLANLRELKNAREDIRKISVQQDLSQEDRLKRKTLLAQAQEKNNTEAPEAFLYRVRGPPHALRIVKVFKKPTSHV